MREQELREDREVSSSIFELRGTEKYIGFVYKSNMEKLCMERQDV